MNEQGFTAVVSYPFAAIPTQIIKGGHGLTNLAILAVLLSHGETWASAETMASWVGCNKKTIYKGLKYWGSYKGDDLTVYITPREGKTSSYKAFVHRMSNEQPYPKVGEVPYPKVGAHPKVGQYKEVLLTTPATTPASTTATTSATTIRNNTIAILPFSTPPEGAAPGAAVAVIKSSKKEVAPISLAEIEINKCLSAFYKINPGLNFGRKDQRQAAGWLLGKFGIKTVIGLINYVISIQEDKYAPVITTPVQLKDKYATLEVYYKKNMNNHNKLMSI